MSNIIFRLPEDSGLSNTIKHWEKSIQYESEQIGKITSTNPKSTCEPTSIPSPFARLALIKTAFSVVAREWEKAPRVYHKIVSDTLDVGQIFFNFEKYSRYIQIIEWNKTNDLQTLLSGNSANIQIGKTLELYLNQDSENYNFDKLESLFILQCTHPISNNTNNIIGATSPATLFFSSPNDLSYVSEIINFGDDVPFDNEYKSLNHRHIEYQKYWYLLQKNNPNFNSLFPEVAAYLSTSYNKLDVESRGVINKLDDSSWSNYKDITVGGAGNPVSVNGIILKQKESPSILESDFELKPTKEQSNKIPLILPIDKFTSKLKYVTADWDSNTSVPFYDDKPFSARVLPADGSLYPYLTVSDFLEDAIIRLPYPVNGNSFFEANCKDVGYLLPLKKAFFDYFNVGDLYGEVDGKKMFELEPNVGGVKVYLRVPIKEGFIEYSRIYYEKNQADLSRNKGALLDYSFDFALFPNIKFAREADAYYRFALISDIAEKKHYTVHCIGRDNVEISSDPVLRNLNDTNYAQCLHYHLDRKLFDYLQISIDGNKGLIIPSFVEEVEGARQFTFAVDLGTTNTHIEYKVNDDPSKPFDISDSDKQIVLLSKKGDTFLRYKFLLDQDLIPDIIREGSKFNFPIRTALSEASNINWESAVYAMVNANIPFVYEKRPINDYNQLTTNLKWSTEKNSQYRIKTYIETLFLIMRNKVLLNGGSLKNTKIVWFYPISMSQHRLDSFRTEWDDNYVRYFGPKSDNVISMTESIAPYEYYKSTVNYASELVSIDIGGGTSDMVLAHRGEVEYITSFRFAADSIFGDGYTTNRSGAIQNGIVRQFKSEILHTLEQNNMADLINVFKKLDGRNVSSEISSFLFSLSSNHDIIEKDIKEKVDFNRILKNDGKHKIVFVLFYTAIIYHLANILKSRELHMPRLITFSGNGSKVINVLSTDKSVLESFTKLIFRKIYGDVSIGEGELTIEHNIKNPKEATCKGGLSSEVERNKQLVAGDKKVVLRALNQGFFTSTDTYNSIDESELIKNTVEDAKQFIDFTLNLNKNFSFSENFGVDEKYLNLARKVCYKDLETYTTRGLQMKKSEVAGDSTIEETFFFYPLNGMLHALTNEIYDNQK